MADALEPPMPAAPRSEFTTIAITVLAICFAMNMVSRGVSESFAVFLPAIEAETGWSRTALSAIGALYMASHGVAGPIAGSALDRFGARAVYSFGLLVYGAGYVLASQASDYWQVALCLGPLIGFGVAATGMAAATALVSRWFDRRISLAMGVAYAGLSIGMITMAPLADRLIAAFGWRDAYLWIGTALLILIAPIQVAPWRRLSGARSPSGPGAPQRTILVPRAILGLRPFWGLFNVFFFTSVAIWAVMLQLVAYLQSIGFSPLAAATTYGAVGSVSVVGIVATGFLADRYGRRLIVTLSYVLTILGVALLWALGAAPNIVLLTACVAVFGVTLGARGPVVSTLVARLFPNNIGAVFGGITIGLGLGSATGAWLSGALYDLTGGYEAIFALSIAASLIGLSQFWLIRPLGDGAWSADAPPPGATRA